MITKKNKLKVKRRKRTYSAEEKAAALAALRLNHGNIRGTAKKLGIPQTSLRQWKERADTEGRRIKATEIVETSLSDAFEKAIRASLVRLTEILPRSGVGANLDAMKTLSENFLAFKERMSDLSITKNRDSRSVTAELGLLLQRAADRRERNN